MARRCCCGKAEGHFGAGSVSGRRYRWSGVEGDAENEAENQHGRKHEQRTRALLAYGGDNYAESTEKEGCLRPKSGRTEAILQFAERVRVENRAHRAEAGDACGHNSGEREAANPLREAGFALDLAPVPPSESDDESYDENCEQRHESWPKMTRRFCGNSHARRQSTSVDGKLFIINNLE